LWIRIKAFVVWLLAKIVLATLRLRVSGLDNVEAAGSGGRPVLYAFWHGRQLALLRANPAPRLTVMTSLSRDGEMQTGVMRRFGLEVVRGSSSRGGLAGMLALSRCLSDGSSVGMAVDGPRGPAFVAKPGIVALARRSGAAIVPLTAGFRRRLQLKRAWDRFNIPMPFTRSLVVFGKPIRVQSQAKPAEMEKTAAMLTEALRELTEDADRAVRARVDAGEGAG